MPILRYTGSNIDFICLTVIKPEMLAGEHDWAQQRQYESPTCLPLAEVELKGDFGHLKTKAAVVSNKADKGRYLLGNRTVAIIKKLKDFTVPQQINAIQTRSRKRLEEQKEVTHVKERDPVTLEETELAIAVDIEIDDDYLFSFPPKEEFEGLTLLKINSKAFISAQQSCKELHSLTKKILETIDAEKEFKILPNKLLVKRRLIGMEELTLSFIDIELMPDEPVLLKPYRTSPRQNKILPRKIQKMLAMKIIQVGYYDYTSPMVLVEVPGKEPRPSIDYRNRNRITKSKFYPLPNIEERIETVFSSKYNTLQFWTYQKGFLPCCENLRKGGGVTVLFCRSIKG
ncbi:hypothetical protein HNY73_017430 [Argiope bruennichi]|uniref:Uncharacterized protein n=1 Tax=Argiope bruennichi TaxID=94029 RepID=A0A8T0EB08_ARGBR|nr:hypothetical protein HNY73_017430 [Argiope bruennichi]